MPGVRSLARERARHAVTAPARYAQLHAMLVAELPAHDRALIGNESILRYLHDTLQLRRRNGHPLTVRMLRRWRRDESCPLVGGCYLIGRHFAPPLSTTHALTAWVLSRRSSNEPQLFCVAPRVDPTSAQRAGGSGVVTFPAVADIARLHSRAAAVR
jgi:hypothetical protein